MTTKIEKLLGEASVLVVVIPALIFLMSFAYMLGYYGYFNIPFDFISLQTQDIATVSLLAIIIVICIGLFDFAAFNCFFKYFFKHYPSGSTILANQYFDYVMFIVYLPILIVLFVLDVPVELIWILISAPILFLCDFIIHHFSFLRKQKKTKNSEKQINNTDGSKHFVEIPSITEIVLGRRVMLYLLLMIAFFFFSVGFGEFFARSQKDFYIIDNRTDIVGIIINEDSIIIKKQDDSSLSTTGVILLSDVKYIEKKENIEFQSLVRTINDSRFMKRRKK